MSFNLLSAQDISQTLDAKIQNLMSAPNMLAANVSFYVSDDKGNLVYEYNGNKGLSTASTQKVFTAIAALEKLGKDYKYTTKVAYSGTISHGILNGDLYLFSNGDPTLGSWRYTGYKPEDFKKKFLEAIQESGIKSINGNLIIDDSYFDAQTTPGGWPWNDIGNYYGAGVWGVNWNENQFDVNIAGAKQIKSFKYEPVNVRWINQLKAKGSGDQSIIYTAPFSEVIIIDGSLPANKTMTVSGSIPNPPMVLGNLMKNWLSEQNISLEGSVTTAHLEKLYGNEVQKFPEQKNFFQYHSPTLDKIIYWFLRKSVNLYGETLVKTFSTEKGESSFESGVAELKNFWKSKGIPTAMINFKDGSGLSPQNYVSAKAEVLALLYAQKQDYYSVFYEALPTINGMKMKSGTINSSKAYAGYQKSKSGKNYVFSFIVNNYSGGDINAQMFQILDVLK